MNPPFQEVGAGSPSPHQGRVAAHQESVLGLRDWIKFATTMARPGGCITMIHRADRLDDVIAALKGRAGGCELFPLWPGSGKPAKRIIIRAYKGNDGPLILLPGLELHEPGAKYTQAAEQILRHAGALDFTGNQN
jgi:tRNA1(Val) A37 N6-methylase TrmN6